MAKKSVLEAVFTAPPLVEPAIASAAGTTPMWNPGWGEAWWWLLFPLLNAVLVPVVYQLSPNFYIHRVLPEGFGYLEVLQFTLMFIGFVICLYLLTRPFVRNWPLLRRLIILFAIVCVYIAGEEMSWGQHWFGWGTPEGWAHINRQDETNLHNTSFIFNQLPQNILELGILIGGIILPLVQRWIGGFTHWFLTLFTPPLEILATSGGVLAFKLLSTLQNHGIGRGILLRPSETTETFYYMFILFFLIILARRIILLERIVKS